MSKSKTVKKTVRKKSTKASGLSISRSYGTFTCKWKPSYTLGTWFNSYIRKGGKSIRLNKWTSIGKNKTSKTVVPSVINYYPYTPKGGYLTWVSFSVKGRMVNTVKKTTKKKTTTETTTIHTTSKAPTHKKFTINKPAKPTLTFERKGPYETVFTIELKRHVNTGPYWATHVQYQQCLVIGENTSDVPKTGWVDSYTAHTHTSGGKTITEAGVRIRDGITGNDTTTFTKTINETNDSRNLSKITNAKSAARWMRAQVVGPAGGSGWVYARVGYGEPAPVEITSAVSKPNARKGIDCTISFIYKYSFNQPLDQLKIQYAFASPGGVYTEYVSTQDSEIITGKKYYTVTPTKVARASSDELSRYYELIYGDFSLTADEEIEEDKTYYTIAEVATPVVGDIDNYYVKIEGEEESVGITYQKTTDIAIDTTHKYYTFSVVPSPSQSAIASYYEKDDDFYERTDDIAIDNKKSYYILTPHEVTTPIEEDLDSYYEEELTDEIEPLDPSWNDAEIGGDNTLNVSMAGSPPKDLKSVPSKIAFATDSVPSENQLMYVRINSVYNNRTTYGKYFVCTDDDNKITKLETILSDPAEPEIEPGDDNFITVKTSDTSDASGVRLAIVFIPKTSSQSTEVIGVVEVNDTEEISETLEIPPGYTESYAIGVYAFIGQYSFSQRIESEDGQLGYNLYTVTPLIRSRMINNGRDIPIPPKDLTVKNLGDGNVEVTWTWDWKEADSAEIAWADYSEALYSNSQPTTYEVPNSKNNRLIVRNLETGKTWYFWARLKQGDNVSIWSESKSTDLSSSPKVPTLNLSKTYVNMDEKFTASWTYVTTDNSVQAGAQINLVTVQNGAIADEGKLIAQIPDEEKGYTDPESQYIILDPTLLEWTEGTDYYLAVKVISKSTKQSEWSEPVKITTVPPINCILSGVTLYPPAEEWDPSASYSVGDYVLKRDSDPDYENDSDRELLSLYKCADATTPGEWDDKWQIDEDYPIQVLQELPLSAEITPLTTLTDFNIYSTLIIERSDDYTIDRPNGTTIDSFKGDTVAQIDSSEEQENGYIVEQEDVSGYLDDEASYYLIGRVTDDYGQIHELRQEFKVSWTHQALMPVATITKDDEYNIVKIFIDYPEVPEGDDITGDVCDIYRRSADGLTLLYENAEFDNTYVDPYPTIGEHGGYRIVYRTRNGDYIAKILNEEDEIVEDFAWLVFDGDDEYMIDSDHHIIDFDGGTAELSYNISMNNTWNKDFQETKYLGGSIQGDWNAGVERTSTITASVITSDWDMIETMRALAENEGECHVRTLEGSNYLANVSVSEKIPQEYLYDDSDTIVKVYEYSLTITRIDFIEPDGMTLEEWNGNIS